uniref:Uncharacterized protein n=1 Tax=Solanum lycopersicum TaxID=4081 RepID=A0A3Q7IXA1_SOLLC
MLGTRPNTRGDSGGNHAHWSLSL